MKFPPFRRARGHRRIRIGLVSLGLALLPAGISWSQIEGALVTRQGAHVKGKVEGSLVVLEQVAEVRIDAGAEVNGDLVLAGEKPDAKEKGGAAQTGLKKPAQT